MKFKGKLILVTNTCEESTVKPLLKNAAEKESFDSDDTIVIINVSFECTSCDLEQKCADCPSFPHLVKKNSVVGGIKLSTLAN